jgi:protein-S-isoprenylcysteine O-methyltransferase Ste14
VPAPWERFGIGVLDACWAVFCLVWLFGAVLTARAAPPVARRGGPWLPMLATLAVVVLLVLVRAVIPAGFWATVSYRAPWLGILGAVILIGSTGFTVWARWRLGAMWTSSAVVKVDHQLRTDGPYRITRHPIYTGLLGMLIGTAMIGALGIWLLALLVGVVIAQVKLRAEERLLITEFPDEYARFRERVPALIPRIRLSR